MTLKGGTIPDSVDRTEVLVDGTAKLVTRVRSYNTDGKEVMKLDLEYGEAAGKKYMKRMTTNSDSEIYGISSVTEVLDNMVDATLNEQVFEVRK